MNALPSTSRAKLSALMRDADDAAALASAAAASIKGAETRTSQLLHALETADEDRAKELKSEIENMEAEVARLREALGERQSRRDADQRFITRLQGWLEQQPASVSFEAVASPPLERGVTIDQLRTTIAELRAEMDTVRHAPLPVAELKRRAAAWVAQRAARGRPVIRADGGKLDIQFQRSARPLVPGDALSLTMPSEVAVWLHRDAMIAAFEKEVDALGISGGLTDAERGSRLEALRASILEAERKEEAAIERARAEGVVIARRADVSPLAILNIRIVGAAARAA